MAVTDLRPVAPRSHIDTPAWQSFEMKMRARAAQHRAARRRRRVRAAAAVAALCVAVAAGWWDVTRPPREIRIEVPPTVPPPPRPLLVASAGPLPVIAALPESPAPIEPLPVETADERASSEIEPAAAPVQTGRAPVQASAEPRRTVGPRTTGTPVGTSMRGSETARAPAPAAALDRPPAAEPAMTAVTPLIEPAVRNTASEPPPAERLDTVPPPSSPAPASLSAPDAPAVTEASVVSPAVDPGRARESVRRTIERYRTAYEQLDAAGAQAVWPGVNAGALSRAFNALESQQLAFDDCAIQVAGPRADATCRGRARVVPKVGSGAESVQRTWRFTLLQSGDTWTIASATVR